MSKETIINQKMKNSTLKKENVNQTRKANNDDYDDNSTDDIIDTFFRTKLSAITRKRIVSK